MANDRKTTNRPLTARGAATRSRIVSAAADLIYEHGVDRTSLDEVLAASGASKSQLYHYFTDKDALVEAVISLQTERVLDAQQPLLGSLDSVEALRAWRDMVVKRSVAVGFMGCPLGSLASELANESTSARQRLDQAFMTWLEHIEDGLKTMRERGELASHAEPHKLALALLAATQGGLLIAKTSHDSKPLEVALDMAIDRIEALSSRRLEP